MIILLGYWKVASNCSALVTAAVSSFTVSDAGYAKKQLFVDGFPDQQKVRTFSF